MKKTIINISLFLGFAICNSSAGRPAVAGKTFVAPEDAVKALAAVVEKQDSDALRALFGPESEAVVNPDRVQSLHDFETFGAAIKATNRLVNVSDSHLVLEVGNDFWPFPIPLTRLENGTWFFDTAAGKEELLNRRIGRNELDALKVVRGYVEAQREYASKDRMGDEVLQYAQKFESAPGKTDGLYWTTDGSSEVSPMGPLVAQAQAEGYTKTAKPEPFHGYYYKILTRQGKHAAGGAYNYIINGRMIAGFALVAWPAEYGNSGVMTFIVNQQGRVYQKDLGQKTAAIVKGMKEYNPDSTWAVSPD